MPTGGLRLKVSGRSGRWPPPASTEPIDWPATPSSKGWCLGHASPPMSPLTSRLPEVRQLMWERVGLVRAGAGIYEAERRLLTDLWDVLHTSIAGRVAAEVAGLVMAAAMRRTESRGGHYRADYPDLDPLQEQRVLVEPTRAVPSRQVGGCIRACMRARSAG